MINIETVKAGNANPWDGLGVKINPSATIKTWLNQAELDWQAKRTKVLFSVGESIAQGTSDILYRSDNNYQLGIVTDKYHIVQPVEVVEFYKKVVADQKWQMEVIGTIDNGRRVWALAKTNNSFLLSNDKVDIYLLLSTTFDAKSSTIGKFLGIRQSTLSTIPLTTGKIAIRHKAGFDDRLMGEKLNIHQKVTAQFKKEVDKLTNILLPDSVAVSFLIELLEGANVDPEKLSTRQANIIKNVFELYKSETGKNLSGTAFALLNAICYHIDFNVGNNANNRMRAAWWGRGETLKLKALDLLLNFSK